MNKLNLLSNLPSIEPSFAKSPDVLVIARALWAGKWRIAAMIALALGLAAAHVATTEPRYIAKTILSVETPRLKVMNIDNSSDSAYAEEKKMETQIEVLQSRGLAEKLVQQLSLVDDPEFNPTLLPPAFPSLDWAMDRIRDFAGLEPAPSPDPEVVLAVTVERTLASISARSLPSTYLIEIYVESNSPTKSAEMANALALLYIEARRQSDYEANSRGIKWLTDQVGQLKQSLEDSERKIKEFSSSAEVTSPEALQAQNDQLKAMRERFLKSQEKVTLGESRLSLLNEMIKDPAAPTIGSAAADPVLSEALGLSDSSILPPKLDENAVRRVLVSVQADTDRERRLAEATAAAIADLESRVERQSGEIVQLQQLEREVQANTAIYEFALNRLKQLSVERGIEQAGVQVLSRAEPPLGPSGPSSAVVGALAVVLGSILGVGLILVRQGLQDSFRTADEIERVSGGQVLGQVLELPTRRRRRVMKHIVSNDPTPFSESVRNLRASLLAITGTQRVVILVTSALPGEGKTTLALALARSMSSIGKNVLLIDADMRRRELGRHFTGRQKAAGLVSAIVDRCPLADLVVNSAALEADVLHSEASSYNPADLFSLPDFRRVLGEARKKYHVTIVDTPPTLLVSDAKLIAPHANMLLMAVRWNWTTKWQLTEAVQDLQMAHCAVSGFVMTRVDPNGMTKYGYGDRRGLLAGYRSGYYS